MLDIFDKLKIKYTKNKDILKDNQYKTLEIFLENYFEDYLDEKILKEIERINSLNEDLEEKLNNVFSFKENHLSDNNTNFNNNNNLNDNEEVLLKLSNDNDLLNHYTLNENQRYLLILKLIFFKRILGLLIKNNNYNNYCNNNHFNINDILFNYTLNFFKIILKDFSKKFYLFFNLNFFELFFKKILKIFKEISIKINKDNNNQCISFSTSSSLSSLSLLTKKFLEIIENDISQKNHKNILILILIEKIFNKENPNQNSNQNFLFENFEEIFQFIFTSQKNLKLELNSQSESSVNKINMEIITIFKKFWANFLSKNSKDLFINNLIELILQKNIYLITENYEFYIFIYKYYFKNFLEEKILFEKFNNNTNKIYAINTNDNISENDNKKNDTEKIKLLISVLQSNAPALHKFSVDFLKEISLIMKKRNQKIKNFLDKFIVLYDVLDGFNSHLFKQLVNELIYLINFCENDQGIYYYNSNLRIFIKGDCNNKNIDDNIDMISIFEIPFNYF
jgi:hypothetical protein